MAVDAASQDERRYRAMYRAAAIGIVRCTSEGCILDSNAAIEKMLNCSHEELQGRFLQDLFASEAGSPKAQSITKLLRPGKDALQADLKYSGGKTSFRWVRLTASAIHVTGEEEPSFVVMAEDITQYKNAERQLRDAQKMEAIGRLVGGVAHDFNNLLTGIMLYCDLLCSGLAAGSRPRQHAEEIRMAGEQGAALVQQLLALARQQVVEPRTLCLNQKITETRDLLSRLIGENIELHTDLDPALGNTCIDPVQVQQVLLNLVLNARDAMPSGGRVRVKTSNCTFRMTGDALPARELSGVALSVADNGCGMSEETKAHLFEPFFTTKASGRGNGLGLTTVHEIVQNAGGVIEVETAPGAGTTFRVILPRIVESEKATFPAVHYSPQACAARILVLEDNLTVRQAVCRILSECGYQVIEAASGAEALQLARANHSQIDLVLADLSLPGMNGRTVAR